MPDPGWPKIRSERSTSANTLKIPLPRGTMLLPLYGSRRTASHGFSTASGFVSLPISSRRWLSNDVSKTPSTQNRRTLPRRILRSRRSPILAGLDSRLTLSSLNSRIFCACQRVTSSFTPSLNSSSDLNQRTVISPSTFPISSRTLVTFDRAYPQYLFSFHI